MHSQLANPSEPQPILRDLSMHLTAHQRLGPGVSVVFRDTQRPDPVIAELSLPPREGGIVVLLAEALLASAHRPEASRAFVEAKPMLKELQRHDVVTLGDVTLLYKGVCQLRQRVSALPDLADWVAARSALRAGPAIFARQKHMGYWCALLPANVSLTIIGSSRSPVAIPSPLVPRTNGYKAEAALFLQTSR